MSGIKLIDPATGEEYTALSDQSLRDSPVDVNVVGAEGGVTIEVATGDFAALGAIDDAAYADATGAADGSAVGIAKGQYVSLREIEASSADAVLGIGAVDDAAYSDGTGAADGSVIALLKGCFVKLSEIATNTAP